MRGWYRVARSEIQDGLQSKDGCERWTPIKTNSNWKKTTNNAVSLYRPASLLSPFHFPIFFFYLLWPRPSSLGSTSTGHFSLRSAGIEARRLRKRSWAGDKMREFDFNHSERSHRRLADRWLQQTPSSRKKAPGSRDQGALPSSQPPSPTRPHPTPGGIMWPRLAIRGRPWKDSGALWGCCGCTMTNGEFLFYYVWCNPRFIVMRNRWFRFEGQENLRFIPNYKFSQWSTV